MYAPNGMLAGQGNGVVELSPGAIYRGGNSGFVRLHNDQARAAIRPPMVDHKERSTVAGREYLKKELVHAVLMGAGASVSIFEQMYAVAEQSYVAGFAEGRIGARRQVGLPDYPKPPLGAAGAPEVTGQATTASSWSPQYPHLAAGRWEDHKEAMKTYPEDCGCNHCEVSRLDAQQPHVTEWDPQGL